MVDLYGRDLQAGCAREILKIVRSIRKGSFRPDDSRALRQSEAVPTGSQPATEAAAGGEGVASNQEVVDEQKESVQEVDEVPSAEVVEVQELDEAYAEGGSSSSPESSEEVSEMEDLETELYMNVRYGTVHKVAEGPASEKKALFVCGRSISDAFAPLPLRDLVGARCCQRCFALK